MRQGTKTKPFASAVITISDRCSQGIATDASGPLAATILSRSLGDDEPGSTRDASTSSPGFEVVQQVVIPDQAACIENMIRRLSGVEGMTTSHDKGCLWCAKVNDLSRGSFLPLIVTTGGTGLGPRDVTPEATLRACDGKEVRGISHFIMDVSLKHTRLAATSRMVAALCGSTLVVNLPGKPKAVEEILPELAPILYHACMMLQGETEHAAPLR